MADLLVRGLATIGLVLAVLTGCSPAAPSTPAAAPPAQPQQRLPPLFPTPEPAAVLSSAIGEPELRSVVLAQGAPDIVFTPFYVASRKRFFEAEGIRVLPRGAAESERLQAIAAGQAHFAAALGGFEAFARRRSVNVLNVYAYLDRSLVGVVVRKELAAERGLARDTPLRQKLEALEGVVIGVPAVDGPSGLLARHLLLKAGLQPGVETQIVPGGAGLALISNLEAGLVDVMVDATPAVEHAALRGRAMVLIDNARAEDSDLAPYPMASLYTSPGFAQRYPNTTARFVRAVDRATRWIAEAPPNEVVNVIGPDFYEREDYVVLVAAVESLKQAINEGGTLGPQEAENLLKLQPGLGLSANQIVASFDGTYLQMARKEP